MLKTGLYFVGEAIADQRPDPANPRGMQISLGGSMYFGSIGAAHAIKRMNLPTIQPFYVGPVSKDYFGNLIIEDFKIAGVGMDYIRASDFISMIAVISEDGKGGNKYSFYGRNQPNTTEHLNLSDLPNNFREDIQLFCFGSVATTLSQSGEVLRKFAELQLKNDSIILYDPNTRPSVIPDVNRYRSALEKWVGTASLVKASEEDIAFAYADLESGEVAEHWMSLGAKAIFITYGAGGCIAYFKEGCNSVKTKTHPGITHTVGAGDNFNAGILIGLAERNITTNAALKTLDADDWNAVAARANEISFHHLLRVNNLINESNRSG
jgi:fructokinase